MNGYLLPIYIPTGEVEEPQGWAYVEAETAEEATVAFDSLPVGAPFRGRIDVPYDDSAHDKGLAWQWDERGGYVNIIEVSTEEWAKPADSQGAWQVGYLTMSERARALGAALADADQGDGKKTLVELDGAATESFIACFNTDKDSAKRTVFRQQFVYGYLRRHWESAEAVREGVSA